MLASAEDHATFSIASTLKGLCRSRPVPLGAVGCAGRASAGEGRRGVEGLGGGRDGDGHVVAVAVFCVVEAEFQVLVAVVVDADFRARRWIFVVH